MEEGQSENLSRFSSQDDLHFPFGPQVLLQRALFRKLKKDEPPAFMTWMYMNRSDMEMAHILLYILHTLLMRVLDIFVDELSS